MRIVFFGTGIYYQNRKNQIPSGVEIVAFLDNNTALQGKLLEGIQIISPDEISRISYDKIVLMSLSAKEMRNQLVGLGVLESDIWYWEQFVSEVVDGTFEFICGNSELYKGKKKILIISTDLNYNGATIAAVYAANALQTRKYNVVLSAPAGNHKLIGEIVKKGINVIICPSFPYLNKKDVFWINQFDIIIVNVFQMCLCVYELSRIKPVIWWIHEPKWIYKSVIDRYGEYLDKEMFKRSNIYAVSDIAKDNFNLHFGNIIQQTLPYGIPDEAERDNRKKGKNDIIIAIIGAVSPEKAQDILVRSLQLIKDGQKYAIKCWIIGAMTSNKYCDEIRELVLGDSMFKIWGELTREEMKKIYREIDIVACLSREDSLPIVVAEGMMYGKICIVSETVGTSKYVTDGENGFICKPGDIFDISGKIRWIINNQNKLDAISKKARETYEELFTLKKFGERLDMALEQAIEKFEIEEFA